MKDQKYATKSTVEAGIMTCIILILMLINIYMPIFSYVLKFVLPIPVTLLYLRHNSKVTFTALAASGILISLINNPLSGLTSAIMFGLTGIALGYSIKRELSVPTTIMILALASLIGSVIDFAVYITLISGTSVTKFMSEVIRTINESMNMSISFYEKMGVPADQIKLFKSMIGIFTVDYMLKLIPSALIISSIIFAFLSYIITRLILRKLGYTIKQIPKFSKMYVDIRFVTILAIIMLIGIILIRLKITAGEYISISSELMLLYAFLFDGIALVTYYLSNKLSLSKGVIVAIIIFTAVSQLAIVYIILGIIDIIADFRKLDPNRIWKTS